MKLSKLLEGIAVPGKDIEISGISNNSELTAPGDLFVAIKGYKLDGADFLDAAFKNGAAAAITNRPSSDPRVIVVDGDMRKIESLLAARFYPNSLDFIAAVTGTNGKSSVVNFLRQMWEILGISAASIGTVGIHAPSGRGRKSLTTPNSLDLNKALMSLSKEGVRDVALEASNYGIEQSRVDNIRIMAAGWTNLSNDHLDSYKNQDEYFNAKLRLFSELLDSSGTAAVNVDDARGETVAAACRKRGIRVISYGKKEGADIRIASYAVKDLAQEVELEIFGESHHFKLSLMTEFQIYNLACALGMLSSSTAEWKKVLPRLSEIKNESGRIELVGVAPSGALIFVDFGHNGEGLRRVLTDIRPYVKHNLIAIVGSPGDRPLVRRVEIGRALQELADTAIIVDDNPRSEDPAAIRATLAENCPKARIIPDRYKAIEEAMDASRAWDTIVICGTLYDKDREFIRGKLAGKKVPLESLAPGGDSRMITGVASNSHAVIPGSLFVGIKGYVKHGADFALDAINRGAAAIALDKDYKIPAELSKAAKEKNVLVMRVDNPRKFFAGAAYGFFGKRQPESVVAVTGTSGKSSVVDFVRQMWGLLGLPAISTGTIGIIAENVYSERRVIKYSGEDHTTPTGSEPYRWFSYFKDKGVERAAVEMSSHGLDQLRMENIRIKAGGFTNLGTDHQDFYGSKEAYLASKMRLFTECVCDGGTAVLNADIPEFGEIRKACLGRGLKVMDYGAAAKDLRIISQKSSLGGVEATVELFGKRHELSLSVLGDFQLSNMLCALGLFISVEKDWERVIPFLGQLRNALGRFEFAGRAKSGAPVYIDFSYKGDALERTLAVLRPMVKGKIVLVFSTCGDVYESERRRVELGRAAAVGADVAIITDDSPRTESAADIRAELASHCPGAVNCALGRRAAIAEGMKLAGKDDVVLVAGKGHEDFVTFGEDDIPYSDHETIRALIEEGK